jgi:hypothetical protein
MNQGGIVGIGGRKSGVEGELVTVWIPCSRSYLVITSTTYTYLIIKRENTISNLIKNSSIIAFYSLYLSSSSSSSSSSIITDLGASAD